MCEEILKTLWPPPIVFCPPAPRFATPPHLLSPILQVIHRALATCMIHQAGLIHAKAQTGAVTLIQRFGSAANLNIHLHCLLLDVVSQLTDGTPVCQPISALPPTSCRPSSPSLLTMLPRKGMLTEEHREIPYLANPDADPALALLHAAACSYRIALGPRAGEKVPTWNDPSLRLASPEVPHPQGCISVQGFSLHADTQCGPQQRQKLEWLRRTPAGEVVLQLKTPYHDDTTHLVMTPLEFLQRLVALVPRLRLHLFRFHGVLAPNAALRAQIVPGGPAIERDWRQ